MSALVVLEQLSAGALDRFPKGILQLQNLYVMTLKSSAVMSAQIEANADRKLGVMLPVSQ